MIKKINKNTWLAATCYRLFLAVLNDPDHLVKAGTPLAGTIGLKAALTAREQRHVTARYAEFCQRHAESYGRYLNRESASRLWRAFKAEAEAYGIEE